MSVDSKYQELLTYIDSYGDEIVTRNSKVKSCFYLEPVDFYSTPLVTIRKTAWKTAIREMEWFISGNSKCPDELLPWWKNQLTHDGYYFDGYPEQFRHFHAKESFDQIQFVIDGLRNNPNSRRLIITTWNPYEMANITERNNNPNCPSCCHGTILQFFVRNDYLHMISYQRSADMLLGVPHNWIQYWALLLYLAHRSDLKPKSMRWIFGDAHIYQVSSHITTTIQIINHDIIPSIHEPKLVYTPTSDEFKASDFKLIGEVPLPVVTIRPELLI